MAFYFALFNVSSVNLEEAARKKRHKQLKPYGSPPRPSKRRSKSADRNRVLSNNKPSDVLSVSSVDSAPLTLGDDYRLLPAPRIYVEVEPGRESQQTEEPRSGDNQSLTSDQVSPGLPNGDTPRRSSIKRRGSLLTNKKVTFVYQDSSSSQESLLERGTSGDPILAGKALDPILESKTAALSLSDKSSRKQLGRSESFLGCRRPHLPNAQLPQNMGTAVEDRPKLSALSKLRRLIAKVVEENRQSRMLQHLWQSVSPADAPSPPPPVPQRQRPQSVLLSSPNHLPQVNTVRRADSLRVFDERRINGRPKRLVLRLNGLPSDELRSSWQNVRNELLEDQQQALEAQYRAAGARPKVQRANTIAYQEPGHRLKVRVNGKSLIIRRRSTTDRKEIPKANYTMITETRTKITSETPIYCKNTFLNNNSRRYLLSRASYRNLAFEEDSPKKEPIAECAVCQTDPTLY